VTGRPGKLTDPFVSLIAFSVYSGIMGAVLLFVPRLVLPHVGMHEEITSSTYMLGFVLLASSFYYFASGIGMNRAFALLTVVTRFASPVVTFTLFLEGHVPTSYVALSIVDATGGLWTLLALKATMQLGRPGSTGATLTS
jgi:hypothetical protein